MTAGRGDGATSPDRFVPTRPGHPAPPPLPVMPRLDRGIPRHCHSSEKKFSSISDNVMVCVARTPTPCAIIRCAKR